MPLGRTGSIAKERLLRWGLLGLVLGGVLFATSCGARTELSSGLDPCAQAGALRACQNACGMGQEACVQGFWQPCAVPTSFRACSDDCGSGTQSCTQGTWSACEVSPSERACKDPCGNGRQRCEKGSWGACDTGLVEIPCSDLCGNGLQSCSDGKWNACVVPPLVLTCESVCGKGEERCENGAWKACNAPLPKPPKLSVTLRDFSVLNGANRHPDFEIPSGGDQSERGIVKDDLGPDQKPVYGDHAMTRTTTGRANFDQWFNDVPGVNLSTSLALQLQPSSTLPGLFVYSDFDFFPIDGQLLGNEGRRHNFHFTLEASTRFQYIGGEVFRFNGDDDMWVYINEKLAIDLGGIHASAAGDVALDDRAAEFGLVRGELYPLHFFFAERHTNNSRFVIETSIAEPGSCD